MKFEDIEKQITAQSETRGGPTVTQQAIIQLSRECKYISSQLTALKLACNELAGELENFCKELERF